MTEPVLRQVLNAESRTYPWIEFPCGCQIYYHEAGTIAAACDGHEKILKDKYRESRKQKNPDHKVAIDKWMRCEL